MIVSGTGVAKLPEHARGTGRAHGFSVADDAGNPVAGPFPSFDIASVVARQADLERAGAAARKDCSEYRDHMVHARRWFGARVAGWLAAGMPARPSLPSAPDLEAVEPRILARNGEAITAYLAAGPDAPARPLYDRLIARYARAAHGAHLSPATARVALEPVHAGLALRRMCHDFRTHRVVAAGAGSPRGISLEEAAARLRQAARLYRGLDRNWLRLSDDPGTRGRWARYCRRSVLLDGVDAASAFAAARRLLRAADIRHGIDAGEPTRALRHALLHLAQWWLVSEAGQPSSAQAGR